MFNGKFDSSNVYFKWYNNVNQKDISRKFMLIFRKYNSIEE